MIARVKISVGSFFDFPDAKRKNIDYKEWKKFQAEAIKATDPKW